MASPSKGCKGGGALRLGLLLLVTFGAHLLLQCCVSFVAAPRSPSISAKGPAQPLLSWTSQRQPIPGSMPASACISIGLLGACCLASFVRRSPLKAALAKPSVLRAQAGETSTSTAVLEAPHEEDRERFRALCTTLLREVGKAEDIMEEGDTSAPGHGSMDCVEFEGLLTKLNVDCNHQEAKELFSMLDEDGSGSLDVYELKSSLRQSGVITELYTEGLQNSLAAVLPALLFAGGLAVYKGAPAAFDFVAGYVVEDSLSVDNLFVFLIIFKYFKVPPALQKTCLDLGIYGAVILRGLFIFLGLQMVNSFKPFLLLFAGILLYAAYVSLFGDDGEDGDDDGPPDIIKRLTDQIPATDSFVDDKLFVRSDSGSWLVTPLALCILSIELSDVLFAVDSVPAVFAVTSDPLIVFTSNIAAILGLRSLYQVLSIAVQDLVYLEKAVSAILGFVGLKLAGEVAGLEIDSGLSLLVIVSTLLVGIGASLLEESKSRKRTPVKKKAKSAMERLTDVVIKPKRSSQ